jgi:hypothetical protein
VVAQDGSLEHEVAAILQFRLRAGRPQVLVRWAGQDASGESWEPLENLTNCEEAIAAFERSRGVKLPRRPPAPPSAVVGGVPPRCPLPATPWTLRLVTWVARWSAGASSTGGARTAGSWARLLASRRRPPSPTSLRIIGARPRSRALPTRCLTRPLTAPLGLPSRPYPPPASLARVRGRLPPGPDFEFGRWAVRFGPGLDGPGAWRLVNRFSNGRAPANRLANPLMVAKVSRVRGRFPPGPDFEFGRWAVAGRPRPGWARSLEIRS